MMDGDAGRQRQCPGDGSRDGIVAEGTDELLGMLRCRLVQRLGSCD